MYGKDVSCTLDDAISIFSQCLQFVHMRRNKIIELKNKKGSIIMDEHKMIPIVVRGDFIKEYENHCTCGFQFDSNKPDSFEEQYRDHLIDICTKKLEELWD